MSAMVMCNTAMVSFAPVAVKPVAPTRSSIKMGVETMEGVGPETANKIFDPYGFSKMGSDATMDWFRHAELKHGRVAMAALTGFLFHINHIHFDGMLSPTYGVSFADLSRMGPFEAWNAIPLLGQMQIIFTIAGIEHASESLNPDGHYMKGGTPGDIKFLKKLYWGLGADKLSPEQLAEKRVSELKNGRLAMIGISSVCAALAIPGSVPFLENQPELTGPAFALPFGTF